MSMRLPLSLVAFVLLITFASGRNASSLPLGRSWTPIDTLTVGIHFIGWPRLETLKGDRLRMTGTGVTLPQSVVLYEWAGDHWELDRRLEYQAGYVVPFISEGDEEHLVWKGIQMVSDPPPTTAVLVMQTLPTAQGSPDTLALSYGPSIEYAGAATPSSRWVIHDDFGNVRLFAQRRPEGAWTEIAIPGRGTAGVTIAALDDTSALAVWADEFTIGSAVIRGTSVEEIPVPHHPGIEHPERPRLRARPGGGYWMAYGVGRRNIVMCQFDGAKWTVAGESIPCAYLDPDPFYAGSPDLSQDLANPRPVIAWSAYNARTGRNAICVSCPTESSWAVAEEPPVIHDGFLASPAVDENGDVWLTWWKYWHGAFWIHSYTRSEIKDALVDGAPNRRRVAWQISEPSPKSWWSILRAEDDSSYTVVGRVQAGATYAVEWTDSTAQDVTYRYRIRRDCKDTRYELLSEPIVSDPALIGVDPIGIAWLPIRLSSEVGNPVRGAVRLRVDGAAPGAVTVELFDVRGRSLGTTTGTAGATGVVSFDLGAAGSRDGTARPAGLYFARARDERGRPSRVLKLIVL